MTAPEVADLLECNPVTVRAAVHRLNGGGIKALPDAPRPGRPAKVLGGDDRAALAGLLDRSAAAGVTWTVPALREWLREQCGVEISDYWLWELLRRDGFRWKRTRDSLRHKADPVLQQAAKAEPGDLRTYGWMRSRAGVDLIFLDECGFAPTAPTGYTWSRVGQRAVVPKEDTSNRRVNVLCAKIVGTRPDILRQRTSGKIDAGMLLEFVCVRLAGLGGGAGVLDLAADGLGIDAIPLWERRRPCTVVLDNASVHVAKAFKGRRRQLAKIGVDLFYLPPRSPELNDIELVWRQAKYQDYPQRAQTSIDAIGEAVDRAMTRQRDRIRQSAANFTQAA